MEVVVMAGTPMDTKMGVSIVEARGVVAHPRPTAGSPQEQNILQYGTDGALRRKVVEMLSEEKSQGVESVFLYCNSLAAAVDMKNIASELEMKIVSPLDTYGEFAKIYDNLFIIAANAQSAAKIESIFLDANPNFLGTSLGSYDIVQGIEDGEAPSDIIERLNLDMLIKWFDVSDMEALVLGCTHFPYLIDEIRKLTSKPVLDPAEKMLELLNI